MKKEHPSRAGFFNLRIIVSFFLCSGFLALIGFGMSWRPTALAQKPRPALGPSAGPDVVPILGPVSQDRDLRALPYIPQIQREEGIRLMRHPKTDSRGIDDPLQMVRKILQPTAMPDPIATFAGVNSIQSSCGCLPPDTHGDVGPNHYVQVVNFNIKIFDKAGAALNGASGTTFNSFFSSLTGTPCGSNQNNGEGFVIYDHLADRWLVSDNAYPTFPGTSFYQCLGVSVNNDPVAGGWQLYAFQVDPANPSFLGDHPVMALWPDAYYLSVNLFQNNTTFTGVRVFALDRNALLAGTPVSGVAFTISPATLGDSYSLVPATFSSASLTPTVDEYLLAIDSPSTAGVVQTQVKTWRFHADFATPANSTLGTGMDHTQNGTTTVTGFVDAFTTTFALVPQNGTTAKLDTRGDHLMTPVVYQNLAGAESLWISHTVSNNQDGTGPTAIRWYQFDVTSSVIPATPAQQQTFDNGLDGLWRWIPSIAVDALGDMAIGYSVSSASTEPAIRYAGRFLADPANTLAQGEATLFAGGGHQTSSSSRWGDHSGMSIDPSDSLTFWHTNEYYASTSTGGWSTRIGKFSFAPIATPTPTPSATPCGPVVTLLNETFESGTLGAFSSSVNPGTAPGWSAVSTAAHGGAFSAFAPGFATAASQILTLAVPLPIPAVASDATLTFWHRFAFEGSGTDYYDGGVLETSTDGGATWQDAGPNIIAGGYNGTINTIFHNPLAGRAAWAQNPNGTNFVQVTVNLVPYAGQNLLFRFVEGSDDSVASTGWWVDDVRVDITGPCDTPTPAPTATATATATAVVATPTPTPSATPSPPCAPTPAGMVSWWPLEGNGNDIVGPNGGGSLGTPTFGPGKVGQAMRVNGLSGISVPNSVSLNFGANADFSIDAWIKTSEMGRNTLTIVDKRVISGANVTGYVVYLFNGRLGFQLGVGSSGQDAINLSGDLRDGGWHHIAITVARTSAIGGKAYVDGAPTGTFNPTARSGNLTNTNPFLIGRHETAAAANFIGDIDEVELFNRVVSASDIANIYNAGGTGKCPPGPTPSPTPIATPTPTPTPTPSATPSPTCAPTPAGMVSWWTLETNGNDSAGTNHGTLQGTPAPAFGPGKVNQAMSVTGTNGISVPDSPSLNFGANADLSIDAWIKTSETGRNTLTIVDKRLISGASVTGYVVYLFNGRLGFQLGVGGSGLDAINLSGDLRDGLWHHIAITVARTSATGGKAYVDGAFTMAFNPTSRSGNLTNSQPFLIGEHETATVASFIGAIDEVELFSRAITGAEVASIYNAGSTGKCH